ncbi:MAG: porin family protein [Bacteroidota bacterium]
MRSILFIALILVPLLGFAQPQKTWNYRKFDDRLFHFGFMLGANQADFTYLPVLNAYELYGVKSLTTKAQPGGQVGILTTMKLGKPSFRLRFMPSLSFQEKAIFYTYDNPDTTKEFDLVQEERVNSTSLDFPLMFQYRTLRYNNFAAYFMGGFQYSIDLQSQEKAAQNFIDPYVKIKRNDYQYQVGGGVEFFLTYFKLAFELKYSHGIRNTFIQDYTPVSKPIHSLYNKLWFFSVIFEG